MSTPANPRRPVAVVTGAGRGIGRGVALALAGAGFDLVANWRSGLAAIEECADAARALGATVVCAQGDVADEATAARLVALALDELGGLDLWVNNAGVSHLGPVLSTPLSRMREMSEVNLLGTFNGLVAAGRAMVARGGGRIVNIASDLGVQAAPLLAGYSATKFAVVGLTQAAAVELGPDQVTVNALCPGTVETEMVQAEELAEAALTGAPLEQVRERLRAAVPGGRLCTPEDVGGLVVWLASPAAAYVTGQAICVNGGSIRH